MEQYLQKYPVLMNKAEKKLLKLQVKAQKCLTQEKARKLIKKFDKKVRRGILTPNNEITPMPPC